MSPTPIKSKAIQPFQAVRDNWSSIKPYHNNYVKTISLATVFTAFLGTVSMIVQHGFKMPRIHPKMEVEELGPSITHPNEYVSEKDLAAVKLFEIEMEQLELIAQEKEHQQRLEEAKKTAKEKKGQKVVKTEPLMRVPDDTVHKNVGPAVANTIDNLEQKGPFEIEKDE